MKKRNSANRTEGKRIIAVEVPLDLLYYIHRDVEKIRRKTKRPVSRSSVIREVLTNHYS